MQTRNVRFFLSPVILTWPLLSRRHFHKVGWDVMLHSADSRQQLRAVAVIAGCGVGLAETSWWRVMLHRLKQPTPQLTATAARCRRLCRHRGWRPALMVSSDIFPGFCNICQEISPVSAFKSKAFCHWSFLHFHFYLFYILF